MNDEVLSQNNGLIQKFYTPVKRKKSKTQFFLYNEYGGKIKKVNPGISPVHIRGFGSDPFNILHRQFRLFFEKQKRSYRIDTDELKNEPINISATKGNIIMRADKFDPVDIKLEYNDPFSVKLAYTNPSELIYRLKIFIDDQKIDTIDIINKCFDNLGFIPHIKNLSEIRSNKQNIIVIISDTYQSEYLEKSEFFRIIQVNDKSLQTALWLNPNSIKNLFNRAFFTSLLS
jgi:hypothetical protein